MRSKAIKKSTISRPVNTKGTVSYDKVLPIDEQQLNSQNIIPSQFSDSAGYDWVHGTAINTEGEDTHYYIINLLMQNHLDEKRWDDIHRRKQEARPGRTIQLDTTSSESRKPGSGEKESTSSTSESGKPGLGEGYSLE